MGANQDFFVKWHDFHSSLAHSFNTLRKNSDFVDVTLASDGKSFSAHRALLSASSTYLRDLLKANPCQHPIVILSGVNHTILESILDFMYNGCVHISKNLLKEFLITAQTLGVKGIKEDDALSIPSSNGEMETCCLSKNEVNTKRLLNLNSSNKKNTQLNCSTGIESAKVDETPGSFALISKPNTRRTSFENTVIIMKPDSQSVFQSARNLECYDSDVQKTHKFPDAVSDDIPLELGAQHKSKTSFSRESNEEDLDIEVLSVSESSVDGCWTDTKKSKRKLANDDVVVIRELESMFEKSPSIKVNSINKPHRCDVCFKRYATKYYLREHMMNKHTEVPTARRLACNLCEKTLKSRKTWLLHLHRVHGLNTNKITKTLAVS